MPRKENTKAKTWERDRRKRMNGYFKNLSDLLPPQLEGRKRNKIDILIHASKYIKDLHSRTDELFYSRASEAHKEELARLKKLVSQLISRTQLLSDLLKNAGITVPAEPALEKISPLKWSNKINVVPGSKPATKTETNKRREKKKEKSPNTKGNGNKNAVEVNKTDKQPVHNKSCPEKTVSNVENQENQADSSTSEKNEKEDKVTSNEESTNNDSSPESTPQKPDIRNHKKVKRKSKGTEKKVIKKHTDINGFPAGTLVFPNGKIMPVVTPMQSLTSNIIVNPQPRPSNQIILNNTPQGQMIVVQPLQTNHFQTVSTVQTMTLNAVPNIQANMLINPQDWASNVKTIINSSKIGGTKGILPKIREVTETTMTYKVPIPAIHKEKSENRNESKGISSPEKQIKTKSTTKTSKNNKSSSTDIQSESKNAKEDYKSDNDFKTKSSVNKQSIKRNSNISSNEQCETKKKKIKLSESKSEGKNVQIKANVILDNAVTCKSIENLKQVIEKIGEDVSYTIPQSNDELVKSTLTSAPEEQRSDNNLLKESSSTSLNVNKSEEEKINYSETYGENESNTDTSETLKVPSEKSVSCISDFPGQSESDFSKKNSNEVAENANDKNSSLTSAITNEHDCKSTSMLEKTDAQLTSVECNIAENIILSNDSNQNCNIENRLDNMLQSNNQNEIIDEQMQHESNKIFLNLDTNTTTTMKLENSENKINSEPPISTSPSIKISNEEESDKLKNNAKEDQNIIKTVSYSPSNSFVPINHKTDSLHSDLSNDIFASLQVPSSSNNSESISPTAAFLMAFPIVSSLSGKTEVLDDEMKDDFKYNSQTPPMLLQIGAIEPNNFKINSRTSTNESVETAETAEMNIQPQVKSSTETITTTTNSSTVTTPVKTLPRVISSQTLTESFKIIPVSSEQINRQLHIETNNSLQSQVSTSNHNESINRDQSSMITNSISRSLSSEVQNYPLESKTQSNFNYMKDMSLTSISSSMANDILNKYISTTSLSTNTIATETSSKYNTISQFVTQECQTTVSNCVKDNVDRSNNQFNFSCANDIPTERDLCKLQICPMEDFTDRSNKYPRNKENSFSNVPVPSSSQSSNKNIQMPVNSSSNTKVPIQNQSTMSSNNFHSIKKLESKESTSNAETNLYEKKTHEIPHSSSYVGICDNKVSKKVMPSSSQSNATTQKVITSRSNNSFSQPPEPYVVSTMTSNYEENTFARTTTTAASTTSNFSILSWTTFSPLNSNNNNSSSNNFPQYEQNPIGTSIAPEVPKSICDNFNYLPIPKENPPLTNASYSTVDSQSKAKATLDMQKRSYNELNKSRNMRLSQSVSMQKSSRAPTQDFKSKYKYPMDLEFAQNNSYASSLDLAPHQQQQSHQQQQQQQPQPQQQQQHHQQSHGKGSSNQTLHPPKADKSGYMLPDYDSHANFSSDSGNVQSRYSSGHDVYSGSSFKYGDKSQQVHSKYQSSTSTLHPDSLYSNNKQHVQQPQQQQQQHQPQSSQSKTKDQIQSTQQQQQQQQQQVHQQHAMRPPVNWMMTPEIKHNSNIADIILPPIGKELDFCQNNIFSQTPSYNQSSTNNQFYNNYEMTSHTFPNIPVLQSETKRTSDPPYYPDEQAFSWSPSKNLSQSTEQTQSLKSNVPDTTAPLPTLVGDLALGGSNSLPDKQHFLFGQMPIRSSATSNEQLVQSKNGHKEKEATTTSGRDYQAILNPQNSQHHSSHGMPFLSVSQLVEHEKAEKQHQQTHNSTNQHQHASHHPHQSHHHQQQQQTQQQQQPSRKQRKNNTSPRASGKRQIEMRQKQSASSSNDHIHRQHEEAKSSSTTSSFADNNYQQQQQHQQQQQQKYNQQSNDQWRNRNCKSNYTAEALIGTNTSHTDNSHIEKNLPKYSTNYTQNKLPSSLSTDPMAINYFPNVANVEDPSTGYGQVMNQNFNHSYAYSSNANIYPTGNFITNISNSSSNYMMSLHEGTPDYLESNNFLLPPNVSTTSITTPLLSNMTDVAKSHHHHPHHHHHHHHQPYVSGKHQNCDKRLYFSQQKKSKRKVDAGQGGSVVGSSGTGGSAAVQNFDFPISGISSPLDDYHTHATSFLPPPNPLYQNQTNVYAKSTLPPPPPPPPPPATVSTSSGSQGVATSSNPMAMTQHHASTTSLTNFNLSTIFPEINDKVTGYKSSSNAIASAIGQPTSHASTAYSQRSNYTDPLGQMSQTSESTTHFNNGGSR